MNTMLSTRSLVKQFGKVEALIHSPSKSPKVPCSRSVGPNGAGKTTTMKICLNLLHASSGSAQVSARTPANSSPRSSRASATSLNPTSYPTGRKSRASSPIAKSFTPRGTTTMPPNRPRYELPLDRPLKSLSRGQRVKATLAAALAYHPSLLFLDEPFSNLDVLVRDQVIETILGAGSETTVFLASHDLAEIESFATHVAYMDQGAIQFTEEMGALSTRFREVEIVLETASPLPTDLPEHGGTRSNPA